MSLTTVLAAGASALRTNQTALQVTSQNIANAQTPGYARVRVEQASVYLAGVGGGGVEIAGLARAADRFLAQSAVSAQATHAAHSERADLLDRAQLAFGDPGAETSVFGSLDAVFAGLGALAGEPGGALNKTRVVSDLQRLFSDVERIGSDLASLRTEADQRIGDAVRGLQGMLDSIAALNVEIARTKAAGGDPSAAQNVQAGVLDEVSKLIDVRVEAQPDGGIHLRTSGGDLLVGRRVVTLTHQALRGPYEAGAEIRILDAAERGAAADPGALVGRPLQLNDNSGALGGLMRARDRDLPAVQEALAGLSAAVADQLNAVHNDSAGSLASLGPLTGRNTGLVGADRHGFTGVAQIGVLAANGALLDRLTIDFGAGTVTRAQAPATASFGTVAELAAAIDSLGVEASFTDGRLQIGDAGDRIVVREGDSNRGGRGFSHFFGLNDLVGKGAPLFFENGLDPTAGDAGAVGFTGEMAFVVRDATGKIAHRFTAQGADTLGGTVANVTSGLGVFGQLSFQDGRAQLRPATGYMIEVASDTTARGTAASPGQSALTFTQMFGVGLTAQASRARGVEVSPAIMADAGRVGAARPDLSGPLNEVVLFAGDGRGAQALLDARNAVEDFPAVADLPRQRTTLMGYVSTMTAAIGRKGSEAVASREAADMVRSVAVERRQQAEAVNLDEELLNLSKYQQAYAAAARLIEAAQEMFDVLLRVV